jgi:hypothetical protein
MFFSCFRTKNRSIGRPPAVRAAFAGPGKRCCMLRPKSRVQQPGSSPAGASEPPSAPTHRMDGEAQPVVADPSKKRRRAERDKRRAEAFHAKRAKSDGGEGGEGGDSVAPPTAQTAVAQEGSAVPAAGDKKSRKAERDRRRAAAFLARKQQQAAADAVAGDGAPPTPGGPAVTPVVPPGAPAAPPAPTGGKKSERDRRRAEAHAAKKAAAAAAAAAGGGSKAGATQKVRRQGPKLGGEKPQWLLHQWKRVFVSNLGYEIDDATIRLFFAGGVSGKGEITRTKWLVDPATQKPKGCGFVTFSTAAAAKAAVDMDGTRMQCNTQKTAAGRPVRIAFQEPKVKKKSGGEEQPKKAKETARLEDKPRGCTTIHLSNLCYETTEEELKEWARGECGDVDTVKLVCNRKTKKSIGGGFVSFADTSSVDVS